MTLSDKLIQTGYDYAKEIYAQYGVDIDQAMEKAAQLPVSMHCWQADDVIGCEGADGGATDGIATTGNYPGRARNADEIRADADLAMSMIPARASSICTPATPSFTARRSTATLTPSPSSRAGWTGPRRRTWAWTSTPPTSATAW